ncbi:hypothetical protein Tco_0780223 [Tanacetum coccineum]
MALGGSDRDVKDALSKLLQMGTVTEYQNETIEGKTYNFRRSLFLSPYNRGLFEAIAEKEEEHIIKKKADAILSLQRKLASPEVKGSLDADEDIGVDEVNSVRDGAFVIGESNVESMKVRSKFGEFSKNKKSVEEVVVGGGEALGVDEDESNKVILVLKDGGGEFDDSLDEINQVISEEFVIRVLEGRDVSGEVFSVTPWTSKSGRRVLCYVQGSGRRNSNP